jgi:riboflavin kinase/FMN adenylyltransferase
LGGSVLTLGNFDGVHVGHRQLIADTVKSAKTHGLPSLIVTFDPHPAKILSPNNCPRLLMTLTQRLNIFETLGIDVAWIIPFTKDFSVLEPQAFLEGLKSCLNPVELHVGKEFGFGRERIGNLSILQAWGDSAGCKVCHHAFKSNNGGSLSSTLIRHLLTEGDVETVSALLGAPFRLTGAVVEGEHRGRDLGFPTANIAQEQEVLPACGVYVTAVHCPTHFAKPALGVTNVGTRPTFDGRLPTVETHVPRLDANLYGARLEIDFLHRLRGEERFESSELLAAKIVEDVKRAESYGSVLL